MAKEDTQFKSGDEWKGNPNGRGKGVLNYSTLRKKAIKRYAEEHGMTPEDVDFKIAEAAIEKAMSGDYRFYQDDHDRLLGKPQTKVDHTTGGEKIVFIPSEIATKNAIDTSTEQDSEGHNEV